MPRLEHKIAPFKSVLNKVKASFHGFKWKEAFTFLAFLLLSFGFWLMQCLKEEYEIELSVPIKYKNIPANIHFSEELPRKLAVKIKDKGNVLLNYSLGHSLLPIEINLKNLPPKETSKVLVDRKNLEADLLKQLIATTSLLSFEPQQVKAVYGELKSKDVPVVFDGVITPDQGFQVSDSIRLAPTKVTVYATKSALDSIKEIKTAFVELKGNKEIVQALKIATSQGITAVPNEITITVPIEEYTEKTLTIPILCPDLPAEYTLRTFPASTNVVCNVPMSRFKDLSEVDFEVHVSFKDLKENQNGLVNLQLVKKPEWLMTATLSPAQIEFLLEQNATRQEAPPHENAQPE